MNNKELKNEDFIEDVIISDNSEFFSMWGSGNPFITIKEEIDNQISAEPNRAEMHIIPVGGITSTIQTWNDGETMSPEKVKMLNHIGRSYSSGRNVSICGVGQVEGLVAGRALPSTRGILFVSSVKDGLKSSITIEANGESCSFITRYTNPTPVNEKDSVSKSYEMMRRISKDELELIRLIIGIKIYPYTLKNKKFKYFFNDEEVKPIDLLYKNVKDDRIQRMNKKFKVNYKDKDYVVSVGMADVSRYVKPDKNIVDCANEWDKYWNLSQDGCGVFVELGGSNVILGGLDSWKLISRKPHSLKNGIYICISIPDGELKKAIFSESANKSEVGSKHLLDIKDSNGESVFQTIVYEIIRTLNHWISNRTLKTSDGQISKKDSEAALKKVYENKIFTQGLIHSLKTLTPEQILVLQSKKLKTIIKDCEKQQRQQQQQQQLKEAAATC